MRKRNRHAWCTICIIWIMVHVLSIGCHAKTAFQKQKPLGVMATAVGDKIAVSWEPVEGADGYQIWEKAGDGDYLECGDTVSSQIVLEGRKPGMEYCYSVRAYKGTDTKVYGKSGDIPSTTVPEAGKSTVKNLLRTAVAPIGSTMYVWGGGWNKADTGAGTDARRIGLSARWRSFAKSKKASYNYRNYRYQIHNGLDCSGYVGWVVYNVMNVENNKKGYVYSASKQAKKFSEQSFGTYCPAAKVRNYKAGDIMSSTCSCCGHVWIVIGECKDGSVVLVHSSPSGVQLAGTVTRKGKRNSEAHKLASKYMKRYYGAWYKKYPSVVKGEAYLNHYGQMRWYTTGRKTVLSDPEGYRNMWAKEILKDVYGE